MRTLLALVVLLCVVLTIGVAGEDKKDVRKIEITGMHCDNCSAKVEKALSAIKGVEKVVVDREKGEAFVTVAAKTSVKTDVLVNAVAKAGYEAKVGKIIATPTEKCEDDCKDADHKEHDAKQMKDTKKKSGTSDDDCCEVKEKKKTE
jgi:copper chaperone CopZ